MVRPHREMLNPWQTYRFWSRLSWLSMLLFFPFVGGIGVLGVKYLDSNVPGFIAFFVWWVGGLAVGFKVWGFPCPNCGRPFFKKTFLCNSFGWRCVHCGLPKWSLPAQPPLASRPATE